MKTCVSLAALAILVPASAFGQVVTIETTLRERGYPEGIVLQGQSAASIYVPLPRTTPIANVRIAVEGRSITPTIQRGSVSIEVNGQPIDGFAPDRERSPAPVQRSIALDDSRIGGLNALNVTVASDLRASTDPCTDDLDTGNSVVIFPTSQIAYDLRLDAVRSIADALTILPHRPLILLSNRAKVTGEVAAAALQLGVILTLRGHAPRFDGVRGDDPIAIRIEEGARASRDPSIRLERRGGHLDIVVDADADFVALGRLLEAAPAMLAGERVELASLEMREASPADRFQPFPDLPPAQRIRRFGEWRLNFPLVGNGGRIGESALLKLFVAPDWSGERAIVTVYLNEQIVAATRAETGDNELTVPLPANLLRFSNTLRVVIERGGTGQYCAATDRGQAAQLLPGSGLMLGRNIGGGFLRVATGFAATGEVALPADASDVSTAEPYLQLAAKILASFSSRPGALSVVFGAPSAAGAGGVLYFETVGQTGLIVAAERTEKRDIRVRSHSPIAILTAEPDGRTMRVQFADARNVPSPRSLYLGGGSKAIVDDSGVIWQAGVRPAGPTYLQQLQSHLGELFDRRLIAFLLIAVAALILLVGSRAVIKSIFRSARRAGER